MAMDKVKKFIYLILWNKIYRCIHIAILFYHLLIDHLEGLGYEINPYGPCVVNKILNVKHLTILWHADNINLSREDPEESTNII